MQFDGSPDFDRVAGRLTDALIIAEEELRRTLPSAPAPYPLVLRIGSSRSGSTLFTQWAAATGVFAYPTNIMALFQRTPLVGGHVQALLTDERLRRAGEFDDLYRPTMSRSVSGRTRGATAPNEFWGFWLEYFDFPRTPVPEREWLRAADFFAFVRDIDALINLFGRPLLLKGHILTHYLRGFAANVSNAVFVHMYRDPVDVILSTLRARVTRYGDPDHFFGWRPPQYEQLLSHDRLRQVAGQVYFNERAVIEASSGFQQRCMLLSYEDFCRSPGAAYERLSSVIAEHAHGGALAAYDGPARFEASRPSNPEERDEARAALAYWTARHGPLVYRDGGVWD